MIISTCAVCLIVIIVYEIIWFSASLILKRDDIADVAWGGGFMLAAYTAFAFNHIPGPRPVIVLTLVTLWGLRLVNHIAWRNQGKKEDRRYAELKAKWGRLKAIRSFFQIYLLQGFLTLMILMPVLFIMSARQQPPLFWLDGLGILVWLTGFAFETIGDYQLLIFIKNPENRGRLLMSGLWRYTRHPNYFGEVTQWWGIFLVALALPNGLLSIIGPITITILILGISGIPMLEKHFENNPEFLRYRETTSAFFPWFPKKSG